MLDIKEKEIILYYNTVSENIMYRLNGNIFLVSTQITYLTKQSYKGLKMF